MSSEIVTLAQICDELSDGLHKAPRFNPDGEYLFVNATNLENGHIVDKGEGKRADHSEYDKYRIDLNENTILYSIDGTIGNIARYRGEKCILGKGACYLKVKSSVCADYIYYLLQSSYFKGYIESMSTGSTIHHISLETMRKFAFSLPEYSIQKAVGGILAKLDSKIYVNSRICSELESMAKTLYDYWFVQFDFPDENGKPYRASGGKMVWNEQLKREIPEGWDVKATSYMISSINTGLNPRDNFKLGNGSIRYITVKNLTTSGSLDFSGCDTVDEDSRAIIHARSDISIGDILFASIAPLGRCYLIQSVPDDWDINESVFSIRSNKAITTPEYMYMYFMSDLFIKGATSSSTGSIFKGIRINTLLDMLAVIPPKPVIDSYTEQIKNLLQLKEQKMKENQELVELRDWLLPMLMNGQATVMDEPPAEQVLSFPQKQPQQFTVKQAARSYSPNEERKDDTADLLRFYMERKK